MGKDSNRAGKVTPENKQEAERLKAIWLREQPRLMAMGFGTQETFGAEFDVGNQSAVGFFLNGKTALSLKAARGFARGLQCKIEDFSPRLAQLIAEPVAAAWPFPGIDPQRFQKLTETERIELQGVVRERIESFERARQTAAPIAPSAAPAQERAKKAA